MFYFYQKFSSHYGKGSKTDASGDAITSQSKPNGEIANLGGAVDLVVKQVQNKVSDNINDIIGGQKEVDQELLSQYWKEISCELKTRLGTAAYTSWFNRFAVEYIDGVILFCSVPTRFLRHWVKNNYMDILLSVWQEKIPSIKFIELRVRKIGEKIQKQPQQQIQKNQPVNQPVNQPMTHQDNKVTRLYEKPNFVSRHPQNLMRQNSQNHFYNKNAVDKRMALERMDKRMTFDNFVASQTNEFAFKAAWQVSNRDIDERPPFNPLYIHASVGLGKTHLLQAIGWQAINRIHASRVAYITAERFMYHFISSIKENEGLKFKEHFQNIDFFIIDDMQFLQGKNTKQEFCHIFNLLMSSNCQIVVAADVAPSSLEALDKRMRSRLGGGLVVQIQDTDYQLRIEILKRKLVQNADPKIAKMVPQSVLELIAKKLNGNGRDIEGALMRVLAAVSFTGKPATCQLVEQSLKDMLKNCNRRILVEDIMQAICKHYNIDKENIYSRRRTRNIVRPRQLGMYLAKVLTSRSLPEIGRSFGGRDHTTVLHAFRRIKELIKLDEQVKEDVELLSNLIKYNHG